MAVLLRSRPGGRARSAERQGRARQPDPPEKFYFFTVVAMWLIHVGLHVLRGGRRPPQERDVHGDQEHPHDRRGHPDLPLLRLVDLRLHGTGSDPPGPGQHAGRPQFCASTYPWSADFGPEPGPIISARVFWGAFLLFSWTTGSILSGAIIERARVTAYLVLTVHPRLGDLDPGCRMGLERRWLADHGVRVPRQHRVVGRARRRRCLHAGRALPGRPADREIRLPGRARTFRPHNLHLTLMGLMLIFTGFYGFYAACLVITSTSFPGWLNIYLSPTTLGRSVRDHGRIRWRIHGRILCQQG